METQLMTNYLSQSNMNICQSEFSEGFNGDHECPDWVLANEHATFTHKNACEFIFYIGNKEEQTTNEYLMKFINLGFSNLFLEEIKEAQNTGYNYICLYA